MNENEQAGSPDVLEHFARLSRMVRRRPTKKDRRLSHGWARLLAVVMAEDGIRASELANRLDIRPSSLSELLKKMEQEGYFLRERDDSDSRVIHIHATEKGRAEYARRDTERQDFGGLLRAGLTDAEAVAFCATCDKLCAYLEQQFPPGVLDAAGHHVHRSGYGPLGGPHARDGRAPHAHHDSPAQRAAHGADETNRQGGNQP